MLDHLSLGHLLVLAVAGLIIFGPTRLPTVTRDAVRTLRQLRTMMSQATTELRTELGPELGTLSDLHPRQLIRTVLDEAPDAPADPTSQPAFAVLADGERPPYDSDAT